MPRAAPTTSGALGCDNVRRSTAGTLQCRIYTFTSSGSGTTSLPVDADACMRQRRAETAVGVLHVPARRCLLQRALLRASLEASRRLLRQSGRRVHAGAAARN